MMSTPVRTAPLVLAVPFHNEERYLPKLITSLRAQRGHDVAIIFIDNGCTDRSRALLEHCQEIAAGTWLCIDEPRVGKFHAMKTGVTFAVERFGAQYVGFLDADSYCADADWLARSVRMVESGRHDLGYTYSPLHYTGFERLPVFARAYRAYEQVLVCLVERIGWLANGQGFVASAATLQRYFDTAHVTTEIDLRVSLLALSQGRRACFNPSAIMTSARRIVVNARNFAAWCFYDPTFYSAKDINTPVKLDLDAPAAVNDLEPSMVGRFFARRARKLVSRHLMPLAIFDTPTGAPARIGTVLGIELTRPMCAAFAPFTQTTDYLFTERFEAMVEAIEKHPVSLALAQRIESLMHAEYATREAGRSNDARLAAIR
jgi:glycosyltransferase involved in cell wall biosynthesis